MWKVRFFGIEPACQPRVVFGGYYGINTKENEIPLEKDIIAARIRAAGNLTQSQLDKFIKDTVEVFDKLKIEYPEAVKTANTLKERARALQSMAVQQFPTEESPIFFLQPFLAG